MGFLSGIEDKVLSVSEPLVMESAAGYYIGQTCTVEYTRSDLTTFTGQEPYDRLSGYFSERAVAELYLSEAF